MRDLVAAFSKILIEKDIASVGGSAERTGMSGLLAGMRCSLMPAGGSRACVLDGWRFVAGLLAVPGVDDHMLRRFYTACSLYHAVEPWNVRARYRGLLLRCAPPPPPLQQQQQQQQRSPRAQELGEHMLFRITAPAAVIVPYDSSAGGIGGAPGYMTTLSASCERGEAV